LSRTEQSFQLIQTFKFAVTRCWSRPQWVCHSRARISTGQHPAIDLPSQRNIQGSRHSG
jgi:hypothetical protein